MDATSRTKAPATTALLPTAALRDTPVGNGLRAAARYVGRAYPGLVRPRAFRSSSTDPEKSIGTAIGGSLVPPISRSSWLYVESVYRDIFTAYLGASPLPDVAEAHAGTPY